MWVTIICAGSYIGRLWHVRYHWNEWEALALIYYPTLFGAANAYFTYIILKGGPQKGRWLKRIVISGITSGIVFVALFFLLLWFWTPVEGPCP